MSAVRFALAVATLASTAWGAPVHAAKPATALAAAANDCFADLMSGTAPDIVCQFPVRMTEEERAELEKTTRGYFKGATCLVSIRIDRALIAVTVDAVDHTFQSPPQPVTCDVIGQLSDKEPPKTYPITGTFAPRVVLKDGRAVEATPGLGNVAGVPRVVSWPVETWVNRGGTVRTGMLQAINAWLDHMRQRAPQRAAQR
jgi:hypothetical protein